MLRQVHKVPPCLEAPRCSLQKVVRQQDNLTRWQELNPRGGPGASLLPGGAAGGGGIWELSLPGGSHWLQLQEPILRRFLRA